MSPSLRYNWASLPLPRSGMNGWIRSLATVREFMRERYGAGFLGEPRSPAWWNRSFRAAAKIVSAAGTGRPSVTTSLGHADPWLPRLLVQNGERHHVVTKPE